MEALKRAEELVMAARDANVGKAEYNSTVIDCLAADRNLPKTSPVQCCTSSLRRNS